jgi:hypothetical protein
MFFLISQAAKQMSSIYPAAGTLKADLNLMREAVGIIQHHDAITGTKIKNTKGVENF